MFKNYFIATIKVDPGPKEGMRQQLQQVSAEFFFVDFQFRASTNALASQEGCEDRWKLEPHFRETDQIILKQFIKVSSVSAIHLHSRRKCLTCLNRRCRIPRFCSHFRSKQEANRVPRISRLMKYGKINN